MATGTPHKPSPHDIAGFERHESSDNAKYLIDKGIPPDAIFEEGFSLETTGNAYFARLMHTDIAGWRKLVVVNSEFHMPRTKAVFDLVYGFPSEGKSGPRRYRLRYHATENRLAPDVLQMRLQKEEKALPRFLPGGVWQSRIKTLEDLHFWVHTENMAYASNRLLTPREPIDPALLKSY